MLRLAILFLVIALIAAALGAFRVEGVAMTAAWWVFAVFIILAILSFFGGMFRSPPV